VPVAIDHRQTGDAVAGKLHDGFHAPALFPRHRRPRHAHFLHVVEHVLARFIAIDQHDLQINHARDTDRVAAGQTAELGPDRASTFSFQEDHGATSGDQSPAPGLPTVGGISPDFPRACCCRHCEPHPCDPPRSAEPKAERVHADIRSMRRARWHTSRKNAIK